MLKSAVKKTVVVVLSVPSGQLLDEYRLSLEAMNRSRKTISWYVEILQRYFAFLDSNSLLKPIQQLGTHESKLYVLHLANANRWANHPNVKKAEGKLSPYSVQGHVRAIKAFWGWLEREGYIASNPLAKLPLPKVPDKPVSVLSSEQINKLIAQIDRSAPKGARYYTILLLLLDTGIRVGELVSIRIEDLDLQHGCIHVLGKGYKVRSVPISKLTQKELMRYVHHFRVHLCPTDSPYLFPRENTTSISANSVQQFLHRLANKAGLKGVKCSPHVFRHTFATQSIANGANVFVLKEIMGHSTLATTMKYVHLQVSDLQLHHAKFSPLATLNVRKTS